MKKLSIALILALIFAVQGFASENNISGHVDFVKKHAQDPVEYFVGLFKKL